MKKLIALSSLFSLLFSLSCFAVGSGSGGTLPIEALPMDEEPIIDPNYIPEPQPVICNNIADISARVSCRLTKTHDELEEEYKRHYLPEECRVSDIPTKFACVERYKNLKPCWKKPAGADRLTCVKEKLGLPEKIISPKQYCKDSAAETCLSDYRQKVYHLITFRFYDAEERVEEWYEEGKISLDDTVAFTVFIANSKLNFNKAKTTTERREIIDQVQSEWDEIITKIQIGNTFFF
ncbi:hypothetical protein KA119_00985 [Candidatus Gracilibacteria bacterium]|nr:hypothetical protein [Candidatus Gracilibacteria bacterium]